MSEKNEHHSFILPGIISREAFQDVAVRRTIEDDTLSWFLHAHPHSQTTCVDRCQVVRSGKVEFIPQMDDAHRTSDV